MNNKTVATYDKYHEVYDSETIDFWENFPESTIVNFVERLPGKRVLNLGSGPGRDALLLKSYGLEVVCVDASKEMVKITRKLGFESILVDMRELSLPLESFDGVWAYTSLLHIRMKEAKSVIEKIEKILKPNGVLLIGMIEGNFEGDVERESMPGEKRYFRYYSDLELRQVVESNRLKFAYQSRYTPHSKIYINQIYSLI